MDTTTPVKQLVERSDSIVEIAKALSKFQASIENVINEKSNDFFKRKYATIGNIIETIRKQLGENGLAVSQFPVEDNKLVTLLMHTSGEYFQSVIKVTPVAATPQAQGSSITYARRYALSAILGIATEDDDGNEASSPKTTSTMVKSVKLGNEDAYAKAIVAIEKYTTIAELETAITMVEKSTKFTDSEKNKLDSLISKRIDSLSDNKDIDANA